MDRARLFGGGLRGLLSAGSMAHIMRWCKQSDGREIEVKLCYVSSAPKWSLRLAENGAYIYEGTAESLETLAFQAVAAIGK